MTEPRLTVDTITSDALDALYDGRARLRAAVARVRAVALLARGHGAPDNQDLWELAEAVLDATEPGPKESATP